MAKKAIANALSLEEARNLLELLDYKNAQKKTAEQCQKAIDDLLGDKKEMNKLKQEVKKAKLDKEDKALTGALIDAFDEGEDLEVRDEEEEEEESEDDEEEEEESEEEESDEEDEKPRKKKPAKKAGGSVERDHFGSSVNSGGHTVNLVLFDLDGEEMTRSEIDEAAIKLQAKKKSLAEPRDTSSYLKWLASRGLLKIGKNDDGKTTYTLSKLGAKVVAGKAEAPSGSTNGKPKKKSEESDEEDEEEEKPRKKPGRKPSRK